MKENEPSILRYISIAYRHGQSHLTKKLDPLHIGSGQYVFLLVLFRNPGISQEILSDRLKIDKTTTAKAIKKLVCEGYVERKIDETDKRAYQVYLTEKGQTIIPKIKQAIRKWENCLTKDMTEEEIATVKPLLYKIAYNAWNISKLEEDNEKN